MVLIHQIVSNPGHGSGEVAIGKSLIQAIEQCRQLYQQQAVQCSHKSLSRLDSASSWYLRSVEVLTLEQEVDQIAQ